MNNLVLIAVIGKNNELGKDNKLIWHLPNDLKFFKEQTINHPIVMGYNTFVSLPKNLAKRKYILLTHKNIKFPDYVDVYHDKETLLKVLDNYKDDVFVIGGASIYKQFIEYATKLILTEVDLECENADAYFPVINKCEWESKIISKNTDGNIKYKHLEYRRKK